MSSSGSSNAWRSTPSAEQATSPFIVLKFGGTSVSSVENWRRIAGIVKLRLSEGGGQRKIMIVHSALSGATDKLLQSLDEAMERRPSSRGATASGIGPHDNMHATGAHRATLDSIMCQHHDLADALGIPFSDAQLLLDPYRTELSRILEGASLIAEVSPRTRARVVAMGELMATSLGAVFLQSALGSSRVKWLEAREILRSVPPERNVVGAAESQFLTAVCDPKPRPALMKSLSQCEQEVFISQGFIAAVRLHPG
jgi:diaminopimelate decarboxylase/aspartate kinase